MKNKRVTVHRKGKKITKITTRKTRKNRKTKKRGRKSRPKSRAMHGGVTPKQQEILNKLLQKAIQSGDTTMIKALISRGAIGDYDFQDRASPNHLRTAPGDDG